MSKTDDRKKQPILPKTSTDFDEQLRMRRELGIEGLPDGQELMNTATFSRVQLDALLKTKRIAEDAEPAALEQSAEILLEEIATELPSRGRGPAAETGPPADPAALAELEQQMMKAKSRDEAAETAVRVAAFHARSAALFVVHKGILAGLCMISAFATRQRLVLGQVKEAEKSNEIVAIPKLLEMIRIF